MMKANPATTPAARHRHNGTLQKAATTEERPKSDAQIRTDVRKWEVQCLLEELQVFGLEAPLGLKCALGLFIEGRATTAQIQTYLSRHLAKPVSSLEINHA
jgi:hypothetical protein